MLYKPSKLQNFVYPLQRRGHVTTPQGRQSLQNFSNKVKKSYAYKMPIFFTKKSCNRGGGTTPPQMPLTVNVMDFFTCYREIYQENLKFCSYTILRGLIFGWTTFRGKLVLAIRERIFEEAYFRNFTVGISPDTCSNFEIMNHLSS